MDCAAKPTGPALTALHPQPANLAGHEYTVDRLGYVLWNGVAGTAMQAWRDLSAEDLAAHRASGPRVSRRATGADTSREYRRSGRPRLHSQLRAMPRRARRGRWIGRGRIAHGAGRLSRRASQPGREPSRSAQRRGRHAHGSVDRKIERSRAVGGRVLRSRLFPGGDNDHRRHCRFPPSDSPPHFSSPG